jgi:hypothetical protein
MNDAQVDRGELVILTGCADLTEASLLRAFLASAGMDCFVQGEHHAGMMPGPYGAEAQVNVLVGEAELEKAEKLLELFRAGTPAVAEDGEDAAIQDESPEDSRPRYDRRAGVAVVLAVALSLGTGHFYARAWKRGLLILIAELAAFGLMAADHPAGGWLLAAAYFGDLFGAPILIMRRRAADRRATSSPRGSQRPSP